jgi:hypothetical protein
VQGVTSTLRGRLFSNTNNFMAKSISKTRKSTRGRPFVGATPIQVRMPPDELANLDRWITKQKTQQTRPEAIRRLVEQAIARSSSSARPSKQKAQKASEIAARTAERLVDKSMPVEEQQRRKRALIKGPKEFREIREDLPKENK